MDLASDRKMDVFTYPTEIQLDPTVVLWNPDPQVLITDPILPIYERFKEILNFRKKVRYFVTIGDLLHI
jgi:hypothetical protein